MIKPHILFMPKSAYKLRWLVFWTGAPAGLGAYFCYDIPTSIHNSLKTHMDDTDPDIFEIYFAGLYSIYAFANIFLPFISGGLRDVLGDRLLLVTSFIQSILGQAIFTYGIKAKSFFIMYIGRVILGWGIETCTPIATSFMTPYFKHDYMVQYFYVMNQAYTVGINQFFVNIGLVLCMLFCPIVAEQQGVVAASIVGLYILLFVMSGVIVSVIFDKKAEIELSPMYMIVSQIIDQDNDRLIKEIEHGEISDERQQQIQTQIQQNDQYGEEQKQQEQQEDDQQWEEQKQQEQQEDYLQNQDINENQQLIQPYQSQQQQQDLQRLQTQPNQDLQERNKYKQGFFSTAFDMEEVRDFPRLFWLLSLFYALLYCSVMALVNVSVGFLSENWLLNQDNAEILATKMLAIMWIISGILTPCIGIIIDYFGNRSTITILSALLCMAAHILVLLNQPFVGLLLLGIALALANAAAYSGIVYVIKVEHLGKAYAILVSMYNTGFTVVPLVVGVLRAYTKSFVLSQIFLSFLGFIGIIVAIMIYQDDHNTGKRIDRGQLLEEESSYISKIENQISKNENAQKNDTNLVLN